MAPKNMVAITRKVKKIYSMDVKRAIIILNKFFKPHFLIGIVKIQMENL